MRKKIYIIIGICIILIPIIIYIGGNFFGFGMMTEQASKEEKEFLLNLSKKYNSLSADYISGTGSNLQYLGLTSKHFKDWNSTRKTKLADSINVEFQKIYEEKDTHDSLKIEFWSYKIDFNYLYLDTIFCYKIIK